jgi:peptidoglycan/LPS O-acetylase OafA/YrhL
MFFVLSGALITSLLVSEHQRTSAISLKKFYLRRWRRLGPALVALLPLMAIAELVWTGPRGSSPLGSHPVLALLAVALFVGNWVIFHISGGIGWLGPAWTLGIEEQFYLTWPVLLRAALRRNARRRSILLGLAIALVLTLGLACLLFAHFGKDRGFYATPTQLPSILIGCALGYELTTNAAGRVARLVRSRLVGIAGLVGMVLVSIEFTEHHPRFITRGGYVVYAFFACLLIGHCFVVVGDETFVSRFFGWRPFVVIGQVSYEAYLIHVIVLIGVSRAWPQLHVYPMIVLDTVIVAVLSALFYYLVEQPIRRRGWKLAFRRGAAQ